MNSLRQPSLARSGSDQAGLVRALSKLGLCSRSRAWELIQAGQVRVNGVLCRNAERRVNLHRDRIEVDGQTVRPEDKVYLMLNKPSRLIGTASDEQLSQRLARGLNVDGDFLSAKSARPLRRGRKNGWLEIVLDEGKNRHICRLLAALGVEVLRLIRVAIGPLPLGTLAKGDFRHLTDREARALAATVRAARPR